MSAAQKWATQDSEDREHYRKVSTRKWNDAWLRSKSIDAERVWDLLTTHPNSTSLPGLFACEDVAAAKRLRMTLEQFLGAFGELAAKVEADWEAGLVWLPTAWKHDPPSGPNSVIHWRKLVRELPECPLLFRALRGIRSGLERHYLDAGGFLEVFDRQFPNLAEEQEMEPIPEPIEEPIPEGYGDPGGGIQDHGSTNSSRAHTPAPAREERPTAPPPLELVQENPSELVSLWQALREVQARVFDTDPPAEPTAADRPRLADFWRSHERNLEWCLDTQANWINRDPKYTSGLNPPGDTSMLIRESQYPRFKRARPRPAPEAVQPAGHVPVYPGELGSWTASGLWVAALQVLRDEGKHYALNWLERIHPLGFLDGNVVLGVPDKFFRDWVEQHYGELLLDALSRTLAGTGFAFEVVNPEEEAETLPFARTHSFTQAEAVA